MKKLFITLFLLAFCVPISGAGVTQDKLKVIARKNAAVASLCTSCTPGDPSDQFCEDADNAGALWCSYTDDISGTNTVAATAISGNLSACSKRGSNAVQMTLDGAQGDSAAKYYTISSTGTLYFSSYTNIMSYSGFDTSDDRVTLTEFYDTTNGWQVYVVFVNYAGSIELQLIMRSAEDSYSMVRGPTIASIGLGTWFQLEMYFVANTTNGAWMKVNSTQYTLADGETTSNYTLERVYIGSDGSEGLGIGAGDAITVQYDLIQADKTAELGACD